MRPNVVFTKPRFVGWRPCNQNELAWMFCHLRCSNRSWINYRSKLFMNINSCQKELTWDGNLNDIETHRNTFKILNNKMYSFQYGYCGCNETLCEKCIHPDVIIIIIVTFKIKRHKNYHNVLWQYKFVSRIYRLHTLRKKRRRDVLVADASRCARPSVICVKIRKVEAIKSLRF
jgi:hypothetical protein